MVYLTTEQVPAVEHARRPTLDRKITKRSPILWNDAVFQSGPSNGYMGPANNFCRPLHV